MAELQIGQNQPPTHHGGLENLDAEYSYWIEDYEGLIPHDLQGTFFRNGPGRQKIGGNPYGHWFDGDGMVCAFTFKEGKAHFKNAYVRTPKYLQETAEQTIKYRGFGTQVPGGFLSNVGKMPANPANTNIMYHAGKLFALNEGGHPWEVSPTNLNTVGEYDFDGDLARSQVFSAHGRIHQATGDYINFGAGVSGMTLKGPQACLNLYRINPAGKMVNQTQVPLDNFPFCHDFAITDKHALFFIGSIVFGGMGSVMLGLKTISDGIVYNPKINMQILAVDLDTFTVSRTFDTNEHGSLIHFGNAFQRGEEIIVDGMFQTGFEANSTLVDVFNPESRFSGGYYNRYFLNMTNGQMRTERVNDVESEFPTFNTKLTGQESSVCYTACSVDNGANGFFNAIQRVDFDGHCDLLTLPPGHYGSEPLFAPATGATKEDDGYLLEVVYNAYSHKSELLVLRADNIHDVICKLPLNHHLPHQFHGHFTPEVFC